MESQAGARPRGTLQIKVRHQEFIKRALDIFEKGKKKKQKKVRTPLKSFKKRSAMI